MADDRPPPRADKFGFDETMIVPGMPWHERFPPDDDDETEADDGSGGGGTGVVAS